MGGHASEEEPEGYTEHLDTIEEGLKPHEES